MSRIENLVNAGLITKTGLVGNETAEAWTAEEMLANQTITKTGLDPNEVEKKANGKSATPTFEYDAEHGTLTITAGASKPIIHYIEDDGEATTYSGALDVTSVSVVKAWSTKDEYLDSDVATWEKPAAESEPEVVPGD